jgi:hypothetical protein
MCRKDELFARRLEEGFELKVLSSEGLLRLSQWLVQIGPKTTV